MATNELGKELGLDNRTSNDTRGRLRDTYEAVDYFENNRESVKFNNYNTIADKNYITGSYLILSHPTFGKLDIDRLASSGSDGIGSSIRIIENRIYGVYNDTLTTTGSINTTITSATFNSGQLNFTLIGSMPSTLSGSLTGYWPLSHTSSYSQVGSNGVIVGGLTSVIGPSAGGSAVGFSSTSSYISIPPYTITGSTNRKLSVFGFVKYNTDGDQYFVSKSDSSTPNNRMFFMGRTSSKLNVRFSSDGVTTVKDYSSTDTLQNNTWYHCGFTYISNTLKLYINGSEIGSTRTTDTAMTSLFNSTASPLINGLWNSTETIGGQSGMVGSVAHITFFNEQLTNSQVASLYDYHMYSGGNVAQSTILSSNLSLATLDKMKVNVLGSSTSGIIVYGSLNGGGSFTQLINNTWTNITNTGSGCVWKIIDNNSNAIVTDVNTEWKSNDLA